MVDNTRNEETNCSLHTFERNNYFYGKLLTARDFQAEQEYLNQKRHLNNRYVHGWGVVCGLGTKQHEERGITISPGVALDCCGREIVVEQDYKAADISELTGYPPNRENGEIDLYLCLNRLERQRDPVSALANPSSCDNGCEYNRIQEWFEVVLKPEEPHPTGGLSCFERITIYADEQVIVERVAPRWVNPNDIFAVQLIVTALADNGTLDVMVQEHFSDKLSPVQNLDAENKIYFVLSGMEQVVQSYLVKAADEPPFPAEETIYAQCVEVGETTTQPLDKISTVSIVTGSITRHIADSYFSSESNECPGSDEDCVVLAKLTVNADGEITDLQQFPLRQYVYNNALLYDLIACTDSRIGPVPHHAETHQSGGDDEIDVTDLSGLLVDPQQVEVLDEGESVGKSTRLNFIGSQVMANEAENRIDISVTAHSPYRVLRTVGGDGQQGAVGEPLPCALSVGVEDEHGRPHSNAEVIFTVKSGGGTVSTEPTNISQQKSEDSLTVVSDDRGIAQAYWVLGDDLDCQWVEVTLADPTQGTALPIQFKAMRHIELVSSDGSLEITPISDERKIDLAATYPKYLVLRYIGGDGQQGEAGERLPCELTVGVEDENGKPVAGAEVSFAVTAGEGSLTSPSVTTGAEGIAEVSWTLGGPLECQQVEASLADPTQKSALPIRFKAIQIPAEQPDEVWPTIEEISWQNGQRLSLARFNEGLQVDFSEPMSEASVTTDTFIVTLEIPHVETFDLATGSPGTYAGYRIFIVPGTIEIDDKHTKATFVPNPIPDELLNAWLAAEKAHFKVDDPSIRCRVCLKGNAIFDREGVRPLDGDVYPMIGQNDLLFGNGLKGGDFESWFYLATDEEPVA